MQQIPVTSQLPTGMAVIGAREISKAIKAGKVKKVIFASNCPEHLAKQIESAGKISAETFHGDGKELGTKLGKPFPVSAAGFA